MTCDWPDAHSTNSNTLHKMMADQVQPDTFNPSHHKLRPSIESKINASQFAKDETSIGTTPLTEMTIDTGTSNPVSQKPYPLQCKIITGQKKRSRNCSQQRSSTAADPVGLHQSL